MKISGLKLALILIIAVLGMEKLDYVESYVSNEILKAFFEV